MTAIEAMIYCLGSVNDKPGDGELLSRSAFDRNGEPHWFAWPKRNDSSFAGCSEAAIPFASSLEPYTTTRPLATTLTPAQALALKMPQNDAEASTVRDYLVALLAQVWEDGEGFSGKRPFGNGGWEYDLYEALVIGGAIPGAIVDDSCETTPEARKQADAIIRNAILALGAP